MTNKLNVLFISPTAKAYIGGTETVVTRLCQHVKDEFQLTLLCGDSANEAGDLFDFKGVKLISLPFIGRHTKKNQVLSKCLMTSPFKIESYSFFRNLAKSGIKLSQYDYILTFYEADAYLLSKQYPELRSRFRHFLPGVSMRRFFRHVPAEDVFFFGYRAAPKAKRKWGLTISSLPLGVDSGFFPPVQRAFPDKKRFIYVGRMDGSKHVEWLTEFFANNLAQRDCHLDIVGDGPLLTALLEKYGHVECMTFHGKKRQEDVMSILKEAFLLLHPTHHESFGLTILEAMASGVPVVTHDLDSIKAWAKDFPRYAGYLDPSAWLREIVRFDEPEYWESTSRAGVQHARNFSWESVSQQVMNRMTSKTANS
jgi:glycosyltransferase involved in cell wall biosynthesis